MKRSVQIVVLVVAVLVVAVSVAGYLFVDVTHAKRRGLDPGHGVRVSVRHVGQTSSAIASRAKGSLPAEGGEPVGQAERAVVRGRARDPAAADETAVAVQDARTRTDDEEHPEPSQRQAVDDAYHRVLECRVYADAVTRVAALTTVRDPEKMDAEHLANYRAFLDLLRARLRRYGNQCHDVSPEGVTRHLFHRSLRAGLQGNLHAQGCFLWAPFFRNGSYDAHPAWQATYHDVAPRFVRHGLAAGSWPVVFMLYHKLHFFGVDSGPPAWWRAWPDPNPYLLYRGMRLAYYRSNPERASGVARFLEAIRRNQDLTPQQIERADRWARRVYRRRYADAALIDPRAIDYCEPD